MSPLSLLVSERVASIRDIQRNPSRALRGVTRVTRGGKSVGLFFANQELEDFFEDLEASTSPKFLARIRKARKELKEGKTIPLSELARKYGISV